MGERVSASTLSVMDRRTALKLMAAAAVPVRGERSVSGEQDRFLEEMTRRGFQYFWEQASDKTGQVKDRAAWRGGMDSRKMASIAATGFGLTALCIADERRYMPHDVLAKRVLTTLRYHYEELPHEHGFFFHFNDMDTGKRWNKCELSSIDTSLLLCGVLTAKAHFGAAAGVGAQIAELATKIYERVDFAWMLNGESTFSMGWKPESGFLKARWNMYAEEMMLYLLAIGSPTHGVNAKCWDSLSRRRVSYAGFEYIANAPTLFTHQYSQAYFDFRQKKDAYADYFANSILATRAHKAFCLAMKQWYTDDYWGVSASDYVGGYTPWGGPPAQGPIDGSVTPYATAGSLPFLPEDCLRVLMSLKEKYGKVAWGPYGFVDAMHPAAQWYDADVLGIDQGISVVMAENLRTGFVWRTFMKNAEMREAMERVGFKRY